MCPIPAGMVRKKTNNIIYPPMMKQACKTIVNNTVALLYSFASIYTFAMVLHWSSANLYPVMCAPPGIRGFFMSNISTELPHCVAIAWVLEWSRGTIRLMWVSLAAWACAFVIPTMFSSSSLLSTPPPSQHGRYHQRAAGNTPQRIDLNTPQFERIASSLASRLGGGGDNKHTTAKPTANTEIYPTPPPLPPTASA